MGVKQSTYFNQAIARAQEVAMDMRHEFILPEHMLKAFMEQEVFRTAIGQCLGDPEGLAARIDEYLREEVERVPEGISYEIEPSGQLN